MRKSKFSEYGLKSRAGRRNPQIMKLIEEELGNFSSSNDSQKSLKNNSTPPSEMTKDNSKPTRRIPFIGKK